MNEKLKTDFTSATSYVDDNYKKVREIIAFLSNFVMPNWESQTITFDEIRAKINMFTEWNGEIKNKIKDIANGCLNINGGEIATKLTHELDSKLDVYKRELSLLMVRKMR